MFQLTETVIKVFVELSNESTLIAYKNIKLVPQDIWSVNIKQADETLFRLQFTISVSKFLFCAVMFEMTIFHYI